MAKLIHRDWNFAMRVSLLQDSQEKIGASRHGSASALEVKPGFLPDSRRVHRAYRRIR